MQKTIQALIIASILSSNGYGMMLKYDTFSIMSANLFGKQEKRHKKWPHKVFSCISEYDDHCMVIIPIRKKIMVSPYPCKIVHIQDTSYFKKVEIILKYNGLSMKERAKDELSRDKDSPKVINIDQNKKKFSIIILAHHYDQTQLNKAIEKAKEFSDKYLIV